MNNPRKTQYELEIQEISEIIKRLECRREELYNYIEQIERSEMALKPSFWKKLRGKNQ